MRVPKTIAVIFISISLLAAITIANDLRYPPEWDRINLGMQRSEVSGLIGPGTGEWPGWKGPYWDDGGILIRNQLYVYIDSTRGVMAISQQRFLIYPELHLSDVRTEQAKP